jgi:opacity protein-like surface antigen
MTAGSVVRSRGIAVATLLVVGATSVSAQMGAGNGFLFRRPGATMTVYGGYAQPLASGGVFSLATSELTLGRSDFGAGNLGFDLSVSVTPRVEVVMGFDRSSSRARSEYREWVDNNDQPIEQTTGLQRTPLTASVRYFLTDRGRQIGSVAWVPARFVPFVSLGGGIMWYKFDQVGDFIDQQSLNVFSERLTAKGSSRVLQAGAGAQWNLNQRVNLTGELRYHRASGDGGRPNGDFSGYKVDLSGVSTLIGLTLRL